MRKLVAILVGAVLALLTGCGAGNFFDPHAVPAAPVAPAQTPPTTLDGNWFLTGTRPLPPALPLPNPGTGVYPVLSSTLFVTGTQLSGQLSFSTACTAGSFSGFFDGIVPVSGTIGNDGMFTAAAGTTGTGLPASFSVQLSGNSPGKTAPTLWTGRYTVDASVTASSGNGSCSFHQAGSFAAAPIAALTGTYSGPASSGLLQTFPFGKGATVSMTLAQGAPTLVTHGKLTEYVLPVTGTISFTGSPCATTGTLTSTPLPSQIGGDRLELFFKMADGSEVSVLGTLGGPAAATLNVSLGEAPGSPCAPAGVPGASQTTLTRQ